MNHYPEDIEETVQDCHPALLRHGGAAFGVLDRNDEEQLVVVQEVERTYRQRIAESEMVHSVREAIARDHDIAAREIVLIRPGTLPKTTSGKIQRHRTRQMFLSKTLAVLR
jgi:acyl-CoA synthetase (AMP-forming)/AMP-acid ligase II